ncbi:MAG TPA: ACP S-malonyltransferase [Solirubrobacteraceae bacterium]|nr:ACP S-malonyltransferase [Solirubrobacteraceae bacterium]
MTQATRTAILFPGQGADLTGAREHVEERCPELYEHACELLELDPFEQAAGSTRYAQPAIYLASLAGWHAARDAGIEPHALAGHSLGEIAALVAAGVLQPSDGLELVALRGRLMDELTRSAQGGMVAILKGTIAQAERLALVHGLRVANYNAPGQTVLSGPIEGIETAARDARAGEMRALKLDVSGAFHTPALGPARVEFRQALAAVELGSPRVIVFSSMTAAPFADPVEQLATALIRPVRWSETMLALDRFGARAYLDAGPGRVLAGLVSRNLGEARLIDLEDNGVHA